MTAHPLAGASWIGGEPVAGEGEPFRAADPRTGAPLEPPVREASERQVDAACSLAGAAFPEYAKAPPRVRSSLLRAIADGIESLGDALLERVEAETALPRQRVVSERARTATQLRQFAALLDEGSWVDARIDRGDKHRRPIPKPDLRRMLAPLGPVGVFGASNFPLAYSVAGGDTASALAAGCPVVVKGHPAHPGVSELVAGAVAAAVRAVGLPAGVFALVQGRTNATGARLVRHPAIAAVGFTGSQAGGRALCDLAAARPAPIAVFAEMGSANPVFVLPGALARGPAGLAEMLAASATLASGQFCTCPGLVLWREGEGAAEFREKLAAAFAAIAPGPMVHESVRAGYAKALAEVESLPVQVAARSPAAGSGSGAHAGAVLFAAEGRELLAHPRLREETFGPAMLAVSCRDAAELRAVAESLHGHLTATVHGTEEDFAAHRDLVAILQRKAGRIVVNGVPTGVEVCPAMVHGGPWPASSDARFSAVGTSSILRWARPVCFQDAPRSLLPDALLDENPSGLMRTVDGVLARH